MPALARTACFRGDFARAMVAWAIRESMAPVAPHGTRRARDPRSGERGYSRFQSLLFPRQLPDPIEFSRVHARAGECSRHQDAGRPVGGILREQRLQLTDSSREV